MFSTLFNSKSNATFETIFWRGSTFSAMWSCNLQLFWGGTWIAPRGRCKSHLIWADLWDWRGNSILGQVYTGGLFFLLFIHPLWGCWDGLGPAVVWCCCSCRLWVGSWHPQEPGSCRPLRILVSQVLHGECDGKVRELPVLLLFPISIMSWCARQVFWHIHPSCTLWDDNLAKPLLSCFFRFTTFGKSFSFGGLGFIF